MERRHLEQALENLLANALEALEGCGRSGQIELRTLPTDPEGSFGIEVEDDGAGFADEVPVFDAFFTTKASGTGLGLAIVHRIVSEHGGSVLVGPAPVPLGGANRNPRHRTAPAQVAGRKVTRAW